MYLADTNVLSAGAPGRQERSAALVEWMEARSHELFLSTVTVAEISDGLRQTEANRVRRQGGEARRLA